MRVNFFKLAERSTDISPLKMIAPKIVDTGCFQAKKMRWSTTGVVQPPRGSLHKQDYSLKQLINNSDCTVIHNRHLLSLPTPVPSYTIRM